MSVVAVIRNNTTRSDSTKEVVAQLQYTAEAYSSGLEVDGSLIGLPNEIQALIILGGPSDASDTNMYKWDADNSKIRIYEESAGTYAEVSGNQTVNIDVLAFGW